MGLEWEGDRRQSDLSLMFMDLRNFVQFKVVDVKLVYFVGGAR